jgi:hypothetical protein
MPRGSGTFRYTPDREFYRRFASSDEVHTLLLDAAQRGAQAARGFAPSYSGPTWKRSVRRAGEYRNSIYSAATLRPNGWRAEFAATAHWALQVEFGTGGGGTNRDNHGRFRAAQHRAQKGWSPKARPLGRALDSLRIRRR